VGRPPITIGMPVYNGERYLAEALECVLAQDFGDYEVLISDNASTDSTEEICRSYAARDPRIRYHRWDRNRGMVRNIGYTMESATGEFFKNYSYDDRIAPTFLSTCLRAIREAPESVVLVYPRTGIIGIDGEDLGEYEDRLDLRSPSPAARFASFTRQVRQVNVIHGVYRTAVLQQLLPLKTLLGFDNLLFAELALRGEFREIPELLFYRRSHPGSYAMGAPSPAAMARALDPDAPASIVRAPVTRLFFAHLGAVWRAPLSPGERLATYCAYLPAYLHARLRHRLWQWLGLPWLRARRRLARQLGRG
jgi:glycosyltransferase involved in cell wall biosynthesis